MELAIQVGSAPIQGSVTTGSDGEPQPFHGWVDLANQIEAVRSVPERGSEDNVAAPNPETRSDRP